MAFGRKNDKQDNQQQQPAYAGAPQQPQPQGQYPMPPQGQQPYPPQGYAPYNPPAGFELKKKKRFYKRVWFWLLIVVVAIIVIVIASVSSAVNDAVSNPHTVVYTVTGTGKANISYYESNGSGNDTSKSSDQTLPWTRKTTIKGDFSGFDVSATAVKLTGSKPIHLHCTITVDGKRVSTDDDRSKFGASVLCDGSGYDGN